VIYIDLVGEENANSFESNSVSSYESSQLVFSSVLEGISLIEKKVFASDFSHLYGGGGSFSNFFHFIGSHLSKILSETP
jgi:hypothetical protein